MYVTYAMWCDVKPKARPAGCDPAEWSMAAAPADWTVRFLTAKKWWCNREFIGSTFFFRNSQPCRGRCAAVALFTAPEKINLQGWHDVCITKCLAPNPMLVETWWKEFFLWVESHFPYHLHCRSGFGTHFSRYPSWDISDATVGGFGHWKNEPWASKTKWQWRIFQDVHLGLSENGGSPNNVWDIQTLGESIWEIWSPTRSSFFGLTVTIRSGKTPDMPTPFFFVWKRLELF